MNRLPILPLGGEWHKRQRVASRRRIAASAQPRSPPGTSLVSVRLSKGHHFEVESLMIHCKPCGPAHMVGERQ